MAEMAPLSPRKGLAVVMESPAPTSAARPSLLARAMWCFLRGTGMFPSRVALTLVWTLGLLSIGTLHGYGTVTTIVRAAGHHDESAVTPIVLLSSAALMPYAGAVGTMLVARRFFGSKQASQAVGRMHSVRLPASFRLGAWATVLSIPVLVAVEAVIGVGLLPGVSESSASTWLDVFINCTFLVCASTTLCMALALTVAGEVHVTDMRAVVRDLHIRLQTLAQASGAAPVAGAPTTGLPATALTGADAGVHGALAGVTQPLLESIPEALRRSRGGIGLTADPAAGPHCVAQEAIARLQGIRAGVKETARRLDPWLAWHALTSASSILLLLVGAVYNQRLQGAFLPFTVAVEALLLIIAVAPLMACARLWRSWRKLLRRLNDLHPSAGGCSASMHHTVSTARPHAHNQPGHACLACQQRTAVELVKSYVRDTTVGFSVFSLRVTPRVGWAVLALSLLFRLKSYIVA